MTGRIAEGRFGTVFSACHRASGRKVAVKKIRARKNLPGLDFDPWFKSAERERDVLSTVAHENVIELLEHLVEPDAAMAVLVYPYLAWDLATVPGSQFQVSSSCFMHCHAQRNFGMPHHQA